MQESTDFTSWCGECLSSHVMRTVTKNKGELSDERKEENDKFQKAYDKLLTNVSTLAVRR